MGVAGRIPHFTEDHYRAPIARSESEDETRAHRGAPDGDPEMASRDFFDSNEEGGCMLQLLCARIQ